MTTTAELLALLSPLLDRAMDLPAEERAAWLAELRGQHPKVADELEALLAGEAALDRGGFLQAGLWSESPQPSLAGRRLGAYTLERPIGQGGMGRVWLAHRSDGRFEGQVAVKLLNLALLDPVGAERFRREGSMLARLSHPNIARLLDAGMAEDGQPYLVLEYVEGERLDRYCEAQRLGTVERLSLYRQVLAAVAHAHANLVVHRDLKPSNIMVTRQGDVKLLDFGIAKLIAPDGLDESSALTAEGSRALTPEFAAPEQILGQPVTTATDVYALGVLLYLLLSGRHPTATEAHTPAESIRAVIEVEPTGLGRGDLDTVLAKTLRKNPGERYQSVAALADDLDRYLRQEPVSARPDSLAYRTGKFLRRHRAAVATGGAVALGLIVATVVSVSQMQEAKRQRDAAILHQKRADAQVEFQELLMSQVGDEPLTMRQIVDRGRQGLEGQYSGDPQFLAALLIQLSRKYADLAVSDTRLELIQRAESLALGTRSWTQLAEARCEWADHLRTEGRPKEALAMLHRADSLLRPNPDPTRATEIGCLTYRAGVAQEMGQGPESERAIRAVLAVKDSLGETADDDYIDAQNFLALAERAQGRYREALASFDRALAAADRAGLGGTMFASIVDHNRGLTLREVGETAEAERVLHRALVFAAVGGSGRIHWQPLVHYAEAAMAEGKSDSAFKYFGKLVEQAVEDTNAYWEVRGVFGRARAALALGRVGAARADAARFRRLVAEFPRPIMTDDHMPDPRTLDALLDAAEGDHARAHRTAMALLKDHGYFEGKDPQRLRLAATVAAETAIASGQGEVAMGLSRRLLESARVDSLAERRSTWVAQARELEVRAADLVRVSGTP